MTTNTTLFDRVSNKLKLEFQAARQRGMETNNAFFSWGGTMAPKPYFRNLVAVIVGMIVTSLGFFGLISAGVAGAAVAPDAWVDYGWASVWNAGLHWILSVSYYVLGAIYGVVCSALVASLADRRIRDIRGTQEWHAEILALGFALSLVPVLGWFVFAGALALAFVPGKVSEAAGPVAVPATGASDAVQPQ